MPIPASDDAAFSSITNNFGQYFLTLAGTRQDLRENSASRAVHPDRDGSSPTSRLHCEIYPLLSRRPTSVQPLKFETLTKDLSFRAIRTAMAETSALFYLAPAGQDPWHSAFALVCDDKSYDEMHWTGHSVRSIASFIFTRLLYSISWTPAQGLKYYLRNPLTYEPKLHWMRACCRSICTSCNTSRCSNRSFRRFIKYLGPTRPTTLLTAFRTPISSNPRAW